MKSRLVMPKRYNEKQFKGKLSLQTGLIFMYYMKPVTKIFMYSDAKWFKVPFNELHFMFWFFSCLYQDASSILCIIFINICMSTYFRYWSRLYCSMCVKLSLWTLIVFVFGGAKLSITFCDIDGYVKWYVLH